MEAIRSKDGTMIINLTAGTITILPPQKKDV